MSSVDLLDALWRATLGVSLALMLIALLRRPVRRAFGASVAYWIWLLVPSMTLLAAVGRPALHADGLQLIEVAPLALPAAAMIVTDSASAISRTPILLALWALGALVFLSLRVVAQRRWRRAIGKLHPDHDGVAWAGPHDSLPALVGWPKAVIVLPDDFSSRFSPRAQELVLAHERRHLARGDLHAQAIFEGFRALLWFNPLMHWASAAFRHDQELACDAEVLAAAPQACADYARALLHCANGSAPPLATAWGFSHPLKERLLMLQQSSPSTLVRRVGVFAILLVVTLSSVVAWASLPRSVPVDAGLLRQTWSFTIDDGTHRGPFLLMDKPGVPVEIQFEAGGEPWRVRSSATALADGRFDVQAEIYRGSMQIAKPRLVLNAEGGAIQVGDESAEGFKGIRAEVQVEAGDGVGASIAVPHYPASALAAKQEGQVVLRVTTDAEGRATAVAVERSSGHPELDASAVASARTWQFNPSIEGGALAGGDLLVPVRFEAEGPSAGEP